MYCGFPVERNQMSHSCSNIQVALYGGWKKEDPDMRFGLLQLNSNLICQVNTYKSQTLKGQCDVMSPINSEKASLKACFP